MLEQHRLFRLDRGESGLSEFSESFPLEARALAIAFSYAVGAAIVELAIRVNAERRPLEHAARSPSQVAH